MEKNGLGKEWRGVADDSYRSLTYCVGKLSRFKAPFKKKKGFLTDGKLVDVHERGTGWWWLCFWW